MQEESGLLNPYDFISNNLSYTFLTDKRIEYFAYFIETSGYFTNYPEFDKDILSFGFAPRQSRSEAYYLNTEGCQKREKSLDMRVKDTVFSILLKFTHNHPDKSIIFICDNTDYREICRYRLFSYWYQKISGIMHTGVTKYDADIYGIEKFYAHASIIIRNEHASHGKIREAFYDIRNELIAKGY